MTYLCAMNHRNTKMDTLRRLLWAAALALPVSAMGMEVTASPPEDAPTEGVRPATSSAVTIEDCMTSAEENYPLVVRYDLIKQTEQFTLSNIAKGWLPQIGAYAQLTGQSAVTELPAVLEQLLTAQGMKVRGISPVQYRAGIDVQQTVYDGGAIGASREVTRAQTAVDAARNAVDIYAVRQRVCEVYFGWLLVEERLALNATLQTMLSGNVDKLMALHAKGVATKSDVDVMRAELATARQQQTEMESTREALQRVLSLLCGQEVTAVVRPALTPEAPTGIRPEMTLFDRQEAVVDAREKALRTQLMPRVGLFAQGYYGYMGMDMYRDMFHRTPTLNALIGARLTWNISPLYTRRADLSRLQLNRQEIDAARQTFVFNQRLQSAQEQQNIVRYRRLMAEDDEIVALRRSVREAAEAKLAGGIIDTNQLLQELVREHQASISKTIHEVECLKAIYELQHIQGQ